MDELQLVKLERDRAKGRRHQEVWDEFVNPIFEVKKQEIYEAFCNALTSDVDTLVMLKTQHNSLGVIQDEFNEKIISGKLAEEALENSK